MQARLVDLMKQAGRRRREIESFVYFRLYPRGLRKRLRRTHHFRQWWRAPMNYVRLMEVPLSLELLCPLAGERILDIGSPKLLALYLMARGHQVIGSDINDYFVNDFRIYGSSFGFEARTGVIDARCLPFSDGSFDSVFSISVLEHIPGAGDLESMQEIRRVLVPGGKVILTMPAASTYLEEWQSEPSFYWKEASVTREGAVFYQRRYDACHLEDLLDSAKLVLDERVYIAEHPVQEPRMGDNGLLMHNFHYIQGTKAARICSMLARRLKVPLMQYAYYKACSARRHYLTLDPSDPNIRQVVLRLRRPST